MWSAFPPSSADALWIAITAVALDRGVADLPGSALQKARLAVLQSSKGLLWRGQRSKGRSSWHVANRKHKRREKFVFLFWSDVRADSRLQPSPLHPPKCCSPGHLMHMFLFSFFFTFSNKPFYSVQYENRLADLEMISCHFIWTVI